MLAFEVSESLTTNIQDFLSVSKRVTLTAVFICTVLIVIKVDSCDSSKANRKLMSLIIILEIKSDFT